MEQLLDYVMVYKFIKAFPTLVILSPASEGWATAGLAFVRAEVAERWDKAYGNVRAQDESWEGKGKGAR